MHATWSNALQHGQMLPCITAPTAGGSGGGVVHQLVTPLSRLHTGWSHMVVKVEPVADAQPPLYSHLQYVHCAHASLHPPS